jgi:deoxyribose-phosphate aldolase
VKPCFTAAAARVLAGSGVAVCAVNGFPHGSSITATKIFETSEAIRNLDDLLKFRDLGCARIGAAATVAILAGAESRFADSTAIAAVPDNSTGS